MNNEGVVHRRRESYRNEWRWMGKAEKGLNFICLSSGLCKWSCCLGGFPAWKKEVRKVCPRTPRGCSLCRLDIESGWRNGPLTLESDFYLFLLGLKPSLGYKQKGDNGKTQQTRNLSKLQNLFLSFFFFKI